MNFLNLTQIKNGLDVELFGVFLELLVIYFLISHYNKKREKKKTYRIKDLIYSQLLNNSINFRNTITKDSLKKPELKYVQFGKENHILVDMSSNDIDIYNIDTLNQINILRSNIRNIISYNEVFIGEYIYFSSLRLIFKLENITLNNNEFPLFEVNKYIDELIEFGTIISSEDYLKKNTDIVLERWSNDLKNSDDYFE